jgi:hypothetical protein
MNLTIILEYHNNQTYTSNTLNHIQKSLHEGYYYKSILKPLPQVETKLRQIQSVTSNMF